MTPILNNLFFSCFTISKCISRQCFKPVLGYFHYCGIYFWFLPYRRFSYNFKFLGFLRSLSIKLCLASILYIWKYICIDIIIRLWLPRGSNPRPWDFYQHTEINSIKCLHVPRVLPGLLVKRVLIWTVSFILDRHTPQGTFWQFLWHSKLLNRIILSRLVLSIKLFPCGKREQLNRQYQSG